MKIPKEQEARVEFIKEILAKCQYTQNDRQTRDKRLRQWFLYGSDGLASARFNKILPSCELLTSFLYAQETTRFSVETGSGAHPAEAEKAEVLSRRIAEVWHDGNGDKMFQNVVLWGNVAAQVVKILWIPGKDGKGGEVKYYQIESANFGVLREDMSSLDDQDAMMHTFRMSKSELRRILLLGGMSEATVDQTLSEVSGTLRKEPQDQTNFVGKLIISQSQPNTIGGIAGMGTLDMTRDPMVDDELVAMAELWVWDDDENDYRVFTIADDDLVVFDRDNPTVDGEHPFALVVQEPIPNYIWGNSIVERLVPLQMWRESRLKDIDIAWKRQLRPPVVATGGIMGINDEKYAAFLRDGGVISSQMAGAKLDPMIPELPQETFSEIDYIDRMFEETIGLTSIMMGQGEEGVRGEGHASMLASMSGARVKQKALLIEAALEKIAQFTLKLIQLEDKTVLHTEEGENFSAAQFTDEYSVKVAAHTSGPIFASSLKSDALMLHDKGAIDNRTLIEMYDPPMAPVLLQRLRERENQQKQEMDEAKQVAATLPPEQKAGFWERLLGIGAGKKS